MKVFHTVFSLFLNATDKIKPEIEKYFEISEE